MSELTKKEIERIMSERKSPLTYDDLWGYLRTKYYESLPWPTEKKEGK